MILWILARKDLRLLLRDTRALVILLLMPLFFIMVLGISLGEGFGQKPEDRLRISVLNLDEGVPRYYDCPAMLRDGLAWLSLTCRLSSRDRTKRRGDSRPVCPFGSQSLHLVSARVVVGTSSARPERNGRHQNRNDRRHRRGGAASQWRQACRRVGTGQILQQTGAALLLFGRRLEEMFYVLPRVSASGRSGALGTCRLFSRKTKAFCRSILEDGLNPFYRDGVKLDVLDVEVLKDPTQKTATAIIDQVVQGSMLRVVMPWMIGRAFEKIGDPAFLALLGKEEGLPAPVKLFLSSSRDSHGAKTAAQRRLAEFAAKLVSQV